MSGRSAAITLARTAGGFALGAFVAGAVHATRTIWPRTWVLEFQAGAASSAGEKLGAIVQSSALEGFGFLAIGLVLGAVALLLARLHPRLRAQGPAAAGAAADQGGSGYGAALILCAGAFFGWVNLAWIAEDALAFLTRPELVLLDLAGFLGLLAALVVFDELARRAPWSPAAADAGALGAVLGAVLATVAALAIVTSGEEGWRDPTLLALALVTYLASLPVAALIARLVAVPVAWMRARLRARPLLPARAALALALLLAAAGAWTAFHFRLSPLAGTPSYATLTPPPGGGTGPNIVFVTVDTLRADHLGCYGYPRPTSPFLDALAAEGTVCEDASASASWTKPATGTILTGLHPSRHGALYHGSRLLLPEGEQTLAEALRERGWATAGFVANPNLKKVFEFDRGFDEYFDSPVEDTVTLACIRGTWFGGMLMKLFRHQFNWNYENDISAMNREVLAWLDANAHQRFFLYAHYIDPHIPYDPPARYREEFRQDHGLALFNERKRKVGIDLYDGEIRYTDDGLKALVEKLVDLGVWENTLFVLTSDHGEEFFEHGVLGHGFSLYQEVVHVPLILRGPGVPAGKRLAAPVQILDLAATVLALAGTGVTDFGDGDSFHARLTGSEPAEGEVHFLESEFGQDDTDHRAFVFTGLRYGPFKLVLTEANQFFPPADPRFGREALYDLGADPSERRNLFREVEHEALLEGLLARLRTHAQFLQEEGFRDVPPAALTPEIEAGLRALGYIGEE
jgi:arylsulfatase